MKRMPMDELWVATEARLLAEADSLGDLLVRIRDRIPTALVGTAEFDRLVDRARDLPVTMAAFPFGFELPLHKHRPQADLGASVVAGSRTAATFEKGGRSASRAATSSAIARLLGETGREASLLGRIAGGKMVLEYDIELTPGGMHPDPGIFLYPDDGVLVGDGQRLNDVAVVADAVASATRCPFGEPELRLIERVYRSMDAGTSVRSVGAFPSRDSGIRIVVTGFRATAQVVAFLERAGWPGDLATVTSTLSPLEQAGAFAYLGVHFDVCPDAVGRTLGLSCYAREQQWLHDIRHWTVLLDAIAAQGHVVPEKLSALAASTGTERLFGRAGHIHLVRGIHHVKLVLTGDRIEQAKAYVFLLVIGVHPYGER